MRIAARALAIRASLLNEARTGDLQIGADAAARGPGAPNVRVIHAGLRG